ncbi:alanyl-tRNA editing protein [Erwinia sp. JUb26]|uniref:alanyl-tRNA editing protein n=1 Tax=Erwinia sp. JUb26 TaxID=2485126 RepID=UPI000F47D5D7|nr:alanyl-tRNA editing protein [Erwinia sp. JUb26]ROR11470.1 Ser-tRNA(Ala) deacylase AlaX [Erwinia sp. JUb26]
MTSKLYLSNDSLSAVVTVLASTPDEEGRFHTRLAETLFHPQGGGQPYDIGQIGDARVLGVFLENDEIVHVTDRALPAGEWAITVDADRRQLNTRMHSAGHLIAAVGETLGWQAIKGNHRPGEGRVVLEPVTSGQAVPEAELLRDGVNKWVAQALPRQQTMTDGIRRITWGDLPFYSCGGTHVISTERVGDVLISGVKFRKGQLSVSYSLADPRPLTDREAD